MSESRTELFECPYCGNQNYTFADRCWVCFQPIVFSSTIAPRRSRGSNALQIVGVVIGGIGLAIVFIVAVIIALFFVCVYAISH